MFQQQLETVCPANHFSIVAISASKMQIKNKIKDL
jgi:hypothetical protein